MSKFLRQETKDRIKETFTPTKGGWLLGVEGSVPRFLTNEEVGLIHDLCVFQSTKEYVDWFKVQMKEATI